MSLGGPLGAAGGAVAWVVAGATLTGLIVLAGVGLAFMKAMIRGFY